MTGDTETTGNARVIPWNTFAKKPVNELLFSIVNLTISLVPAYETDARPDLLVR